MSQAVPERFENVTAECKANVYFDGRVVSHALITAGGDKVTLGLIFPGSYNFGTGAPERMDITAGSCRVRLAGAAEWTVHEAGTTFHVPGESSFDIAVDEGIAQYVCSYG